MREDLVLGVRIKGTSPKFDSVSVSSRKVDMVKSRVGDANVLLNHSKLEFLVDSALRSH